MALFDSLVKPALDSVVALIGQFHMSPEEKAQAQQAIADASAKAQLAAMDYDVQLNAIAGQNVRAEETNGDKFTSRARPTVIYGGLLVMFWNYCLAAISPLHFKTVSIPDQFFWVWGTVVTGYVFSRTGEKIAGMPGDSQVNVLGGLVKLSNKSGGPSC
jgi:hypothetical protein